MSAVETETVSEEKIEETTPPKKKRSRLPIYIVGSVIFVGGIIGLAWWLHARQFATTDDAFVEGNISLITPKISSYVVRIHVQENQLVKKGDLLIELDSREPEAKLEEAQVAKQTALAELEKANATTALTRKNGKAGLTEASSNLETAKNNVEQSRLASDSKQNVIEQNRSRAAVAEANLSQVQEQIPAAEASLAQARAQVPAAQAKIDYARAEFARNKSLFDAGDISKQEFEQSKRELSQIEAAMTMAEKQVEIAQAQFAALRRQVEVERSRVKEMQSGIASAESDYRQSLAQVDATASQANESLGRLQGAQTLPEQIAVQSSEISAAEAKVAQAENAIRQAELEVSYTKIYAPQDGYVARKTVQEGQLVQPDQSLMAITQNDFWVVANYKETQLEQMKIGQPVDIYIDAYPNTVFHGKIDSFQAGTGSRFSVLPSENATGGFVKVVQRVPVKIVFDRQPDNQKYLLVPGMSVVPRVKLR
ncbi:MAG: efflux RND transporter periplasmic adaptor subunit [Pyrinomonadaceae bacterium]